jgi:hypothetical protein
MALPGFTSCRKEGMWCSLDLRAVVTDLQTVITRERAAPWIYRPLSGSRSRRIRGAVDVRAGAPLLRPTHLGGDLLGEPRQRGGAPGLAGCFGERFLADAFEQSPTLELPGRRPRRRPPRAARGRPPEQALLRFMRGDTVRAETREVSIVATSLLFIWDCYGISASGRDAFYLSRDEFCYFASRDPSAAARVREQIAVNNNK